MRCNSEPVLFVISSAVWAAKVASSDPSVASSIFVGKMLNFSSYSSTRRCPRDVKGKFEGPQRALYGVRTGAIGGLRECLSSAARLDRGYRGPGLLFMERPIRVGRKYSCGRGRGPLGKGAPVSV